MLPLILLVNGTCSKRPDFLINDFEADTYGNWQATGISFGNGPSDSLDVLPSGTRGIMGRRAASSLHGGAASQGTLASLQFPIERRYINFLVAGGEIPDSVGVQLVIHGKTVYTSTGNNQKNLEWVAWDLAEHLRDTARIVIFDFATGEMGYILVDHIVQSDVNAINMKLDLQDKYVPSDSASQAISEP